MEFNGPYYSLTCNIIGNADPELIIIDSSQNKLTILSSTLKTITTVIPAENPDHERLFLASATSTDETFQTSNLKYLIMFSKDRKKLYYLNHNLTLQALNLQEFAIKTDSTLYCFVQNENNPNKIIFLFISTEGNYTILTTLTSKEMEKHELLPGKVIHAASSKGKIYFCLKTDTELVFYSRDSTSSQEIFRMPADSVLHAIIVDTSAIIFTKSAKKQIIATITGLGSRVSQQILFTVTGSKLNTIGLVEGKPFKLAIVYDDSCFALFYNSNLFLRNFSEEISSVSLVSNALGEKSIYSIIRFKNSPDLTMFDLFGNEIVRFKNTNSVYAFHGKGKNGLILNRPNGVQIVSVIPNILLIKKKLLIAVIVLGSLILLPSIAYVISRIDFDIFVHKTFLSFSDELVIVIDKKKLVRYINGKMKAFLIPFISPNTHFQVHIKYLLEDPRLKDILDLILLSIKENRTLEKLIEINVGEKHLFIFRCIPLRRHLKTGAYLCIMKDVTKIMEERHIISWAQLTRNILHEVKNPLSSILIAVERIKKKLSQENVKTRENLDNYLKIIKMEAERINNHLRNLIKLYLNKQLDLSKYDICKLITEVLESAKINYPNVSFRSYCPDKIILPLDAELFKMAISNLINNSIEAVNPHNGYVEIKVERTTTSLVTIIIKDNGIGIDESELNKIFEPGYSTKTTGFGLGLTITKEIIESLGGSINVESKKNKGTTVILKLKYEEEIDAQV
ncbi:MAG: HAMP domain-containing sensor histidine kinase [bacterium]|nr:HAMP domain-containing sensor histidine kinase [bacterium]